MKPFDIFHIDGERGFRGGERQLLYLAASLRARGHRNTVVCRPGAPLSAEAARLGLEVFPLPFWMEWDPVTAWRLRRRLRGAARPVLHAHTAHAASIAALAGCRTAPSVVHRRTDFALSGAISRKFKYDQAGRVVAVSGAIAGLLKKAGVAAEKIEVVPDGIPVGPRECGWALAPSDLFAPPSPESRSRLRRELAEEYNISTESPWIGNLAALVPHKDHDTLLAAALIVLMKRPDALFLIGGEGPEGPRLIERAKRMNLLGRVLFIGQVEEPARLLKALDAFALSSWGEGMGSVLLEAAACAVPIAATAAGGIPEIIESGQSGLLVPPRDPEALAGAILRLLGEPVLAKALAARAMSQLPRFGLSRMAEQMERVYERASAN